MRRNFLVSVRKISLRGQVVQGIEHTCDTCIYNETEVLTVVLLKSVFPDVPKDRIAFETSVTAHPTTQHHIPEDTTLQVAYVQSFIWGTCEKETTWMIWLQMRVEY
jgi:hypothetical protein